MRNDVTEFILLGLTQGPEKQKIVFAIFFVFYAATVVGNLLIVVTIKTSPTLGLPMYFFLTYLSIADSCFSNTTAPRLIVDNLLHKNTISFDECLIQLFAMHFFGCMEVFLLILMAYDRFVAICKPLHYSVIMNRRVCGMLVLLAWIGSFLHSIAQVIPILNVVFCGPNVIDHYFCDLQPLLRLGCMDTYILNLFVVSNSGAICSVSFVLLMISYTLILHSLRNHSAEVKLKALSTCSSHILVVIIFFGPCIFMYTRPPTTFPLDKLVPVFYTIITPFLNPFIYTLRNAEVKNSMKKLWSTQVTSGEK
ncbi:olfactory receptor 4C11-like [Notamacropus eugenii]|uniref:olfactory receptor 4C11-like n=1 Tax=Notamacropus eugenii TaxID=9315 RepID=UPI003B67196D